MIFGGQVVLQRPWVCISTKGVPTHDKFIRLSDTGTVRVVWYDPITVKHVQLFDLADPNCINDLVKLVSRV